MGADHSEPPQVQVQLQQKYLFRSSKESGRILRCTRLPFGFKNSPVEFCEMTEALAQKMRERAGSGVHFFVFVDDFLVVGDTEELTRYGCSVLEDVLTEFGIQWTPHKRRGPARVIEFLGQLISNSPNAPRCIALTENVKSGSKSSRSCSSHGGANGAAITP